MALTTISGEIQAQPLNDNFSYLNNSISNMAIINVKDFGAVGDGVADDTQAFLDAITYAASFVGVGTALSNILTAYGAKIKVPRGTYKVNQTLLIGNGCITVEGESNYATIIIPSEDFEGDEIFKFGRTDEAWYTKSAALVNIGINLRGTDIIGFSVYGCQDGSVFDRITITGFTGQAFRTGLSDTVINQGITFNQINCISINSIGDASTTVSIVQLDALNESMLTNCKVLGENSVSKYAIGFHVGKSSLSEGVSFVGCSVGSLNNPDTNKSAGIVFNNVSRSYISNCTFETIKGPGIKFGDNVQAKECSASNNRFYNTGASYIINPFVLFNYANCCKAEIQKTISTEKACEFTSQATQCFAFFMPNSWANVANHFSMIAGYGNMAEGITEGEHFFIDANGNINSATGYGGIQLKDGVTQPGVMAGMAMIYIDSADGDLKIRFSDGVIKTIMVDS